MTEGSAGWGDLIDTATMKPIWSGSLPVSNSPYVTMWWKVFQDVSGTGQHVLQLGVRGRVSRDPADSDEVRSLTSRLMGGCTEMVWRSVGGDLRYQVQPLASATYSGSSWWSGMMTVYAYDGHDFDPLIKVIQRTVAVAKGEDEE